MYQEEFDEAIGTPPPAAVDLEALIVRGRRDQRLRTWGVAGGLAVAVLAGTVGVGVWAGADGRPAPAGPGTFAAQPTGTTTPRPAWSPKEVPVITPGPDGKYPTPPPPTGTPMNQAQADQLTVILKGAVAQAAPGMRVTGTSMKGAAYGSLAFMTGGTKDASASGDLTDAAGPGGVLVVLERGSDAPTRCPEVDGYGDRYRTGCVESTGPNGESVLAMTYDDPAGDGLHWANHGKEYEVLVVRPGGGVVTAWALNVSFERLGQHQGAKTEFDATRATPPLTMEQLKAIALTPGLTMP
ncbi:hypothetical protein R8Z50_27100 [Longispora sp. K20-0274]|uniref:hypothetical protein n=1 Tax=Longispora sp. K20-0274 TaxID=3088255 RepID=UPI00399BD4F6